MVVWVVELALGKGVEEEGLGHGGEGGQAAQMWRGGGSEWWVLERERDRMCAAGARARKTRLLLGGGADEGGEPAT